MFDLSKVDGVDATRRTSGTLKIEIGYGSIQRMRPTNRDQQSFFDSNFLCDDLIPKSSFYRRFREMVGPLITDEMFSSLYCGVNGRPPISPALLAKAMLIQYHMNLSDRELERACMFDLEVKYALNVRIDERPFDHSSLGDFRERLLRGGKEKELFDRILKNLIEEKLISKDEVQRIDATHIIADIAIPTMTTFVKKGIFEVLKILKPMNPALYKKIGSKISISEYQPETVNHDAKGRLNIAHREAKLVEIVKDAKIILAETTELASQPKFKESIETLKRILNENIEEDEGGNAKEKDRKNKPGNLLVSPIDKDARYGCKSVTKKFTGYKASITQEVKSYIITNIEPLGGNRRDGEPTVDLVRAQSPYGLLPKKLIGDSAYGDGIWRSELEKSGTKLVAPFKNKNPRTKAVFPKSAFSLDRKTNLLTCPKGFTAKPHFYESKTQCMNFHFAQSACGKCDLKPQCTKAREGRRTVRIFDWQESIYESERYNLTPAFKEDMKLRQPIEGKFSEMKRYHGFARAKYRGMRKMGLQCYFTGAAVNIKRWLHLLFDGEWAKAAIA